MNVYFSVIYRTAPIPDAGEIVSLDWSQKTINSKQKIWPYDPELQDPNPRGNTRGGRGIASWDHQLVVASYHSLHLYDYDLHFQKKISHPLMVNLHELTTTQDGYLWAAATGIDAALKFDLRSDQPLVETLWPREHHRLRKVFSLESLKIDKKADNRGLFLSRKHIEQPSHTHLNAISTWRGDPYALLNSFGAVVNLRTGDVVLHEPVLLRGAHNLVIDDQEEYLFINNTFHRAVHIYRLEDMQLCQTIKLTDFPAIMEIAKDELLSSSSIWPFLSKLNRGVVRRVVEKLGFSRKIPAMPLFVRGLALHDEYIFIGVSPASILQFHWQTGQLIDQYQYADDVRATIHGLYIPDRE